MRNVQPISELKVASLTTLSRSQFRPQVVSELRRIMQVIDAAEKTGPKQNVTHELPIQDRFRRAS